jgi:hypothetical protein
VLRYRTQPPNFKQSHPTSPNSDRLFFLIQG